ncbi:MAG: F0F1 ATP synthase subunit beta, partial [Actinomycetota bacterium]
MAVVEDQARAEKEKQAEQVTGRVIQVIGPVIDVEFPPDALPEINNALVLEKTLLGETETVTAEVAQHIGNATVRAICMQPGDGITRGTKVTDTGAPITVPVGSGVLGHVFDVLGKSLDEPEEKIGGERWPIRREAPLFKDLEPKSEMLETGIKVIDLLEPFVR